MSQLTFTINISKLKGLGYTFQKLYANNYKTYHKKIGDYTIWLWEAGRLIEINDWHQHTGNIIEFYKNNLEKHIIDNKDLPKPSDFMKLRVKEDSSEVVFKDMKEYYQNFADYIEEEKNLKVIEEYQKKYEDYRDVVIYIPKFQVLLDEINTLTVTPN